MAYDRIQLSGGLTDSDHPVTDGDPRQTEGHPEHQPNLVDQGEQGEEHREADGERRDRQGLSGAKILLCATARRRTPTRWAW